MPAHHQQLLIRQIMLKGSYLTLNEYGHKKSKPHESNGGFISKTNVSPTRVNHVNLTIACTPKTNVDPTLACQIQPTPMVPVFSQRWPNVSMLSGYKVIYIQYLVDLCTVYLDPLYLGIVDMMLYYLFLKICFLQQICFQLNKFQLA